MTIRIDDEAEPADLVFAAGHEEATFLGAGAAFATGRGDALDEPFLLVRRDR